MIIIVRGTTPSVAKSPLKKPKNGLLSRAALSTCSLDLLSRAALLLSRARTKYVRSWSSLLFTPKTLSSGQRLSLLFTPKTLSPRSCSLLFTPTPSPRRTVDLSTHLSTANRRSCGAGLCPGCSPPSIATECRDPNVSVLQLQIRAVQLQTCSRTTTNMLHVCSCAARSMRIQNVIQKSPQSTPTPNRYGGAVSRLLCWAELVLQCRPRKSLPRTTRNW